MKRFSVSRFLFQAICLCIFSGSAIISAQNLPEDAPVLISQPDSTRALTAKPSRKVYDFSPKVFPASGNTRITFFVTNLELLQDEGANAFRVGCN